MVCYLHSCCHPSSSPFPWHGIVSMVNGRQWRNGYDSLGLASWNLTKRVMWVALGGLTLKSKVEQLPDSEQLMLPMLGCMRSPGHGPIIAWSGEALGLSPARMVVPQLTQGLCAWGWALLEIMNMGISSAEMGDCSAGAESFSWLCGPGVLGDAGVQHREAAFLPVLGLWWMSGAWQPLPHCQQRDPGSTSSCILCHCLCMAAVELPWFAS